MIDCEQFLEYVIVPSLTGTNIDSPAARKLLLGTALVESRLTYIAQYPAGPAMGVYQMEAATHEDIWNNYLEYRPQLMCLLGEKNATRLYYDLKYATLMSRMHYLRVAEPLPSLEDTEGMAKYWKKYYNTHLGKGEPNRYMRLWFHYGLEDEAFNGIV